MQGVVDGVGVRDLGQGTGTEGCQGPIVIVYGHIVETI